jgi:hypothetical protein
MTATEPSDGHGEGLVGEQVGETEATDRRGRRDERADRGGHQEVARVEEQDRDHDQRSGRGGPEQVDHHELRRAGEHDEARRARLRDPEPGLSRGQPERDAHDERRHEDRPALGDRGAARGHAPKGMSAGTRSAYRT